MKKVILVFVIMLSHIPFVAFGVMMYAANPEGWEGPLYLAGIGYCMIHLLINLVIKDRFN